MALFAWANRQLEQLSEQLAPVPNDPGHRFAKACSSNDPHLALSLLSSSPPPLPDGSQCSPVDPFTTIVNKQKGTLAIHCAAEYSQVNVVQSLIAQYGVSAEQFDHQGNTPLHYAASSKVIGGVHLVKCLVNEYHVSVTVKNGAGKTAYDVATQDSIRQYLLPIQLQRETQECIDNGGRGLPDGIDMGGLAIKRDIAPPPIVGGFGSPPPIGGYSAAGLGTSKYAVPAFVQQVHPPSQMQQPVNMAMGGYPAPAAANSYGFAQPQPHGHNQYPPQPQQPQPMSFNDAAVVAQPIPGPTYTPEKPVPVQSYATPHAVSHAPLSSEPMVAPTANTVNATANVGASSEPISEEKPKDIPVTAQDQAVPATTAPDAQVAPVQPAPFSYGSNPAAASSYYGATSAPATAPAATTTQPPGTTSAPSSGNGYAMRGFSSAAVLPKNSKYKPDGFHSSSSDVSLQKKYGHDSSITGPPSGNYNSSNVSIAPPPSATSGSGGAGAGSGYNPYASSTTFGASPAMARPRYPTYDAVSDTVGMASSGGNANAGYGYNPYGATAGAAQGQYNVYTPQQQQQYQQPAYDYSQQQQQYQQPAYDYSQQQQQYQQPAYDYSQQQQQYQQQPTYDYSQQQQVANACPWKAAMSPEGQTYYYNEVTNETTWDMPAEMQYEQNAVANQTSPVNVQAQPTVEVNAHAAVDPTGIEEQTSPVANHTSPITTEEPQSAAQSAETAPVVQEPLKMQEPAPSLVEQPLVTPTSQQTQSFFGSSPRPNEFTPVQQAANPVSPVNEQMQYMNVGGGPVRQTSTASATDLFGTPPVEANANTGTASTAELFSPGLLSDVKAEVNQAFEDANDSDDSLSPPPIGTEEHFPVGDNLPLEGEDDDDFLPPPPFGESSNDNDQSGQDDDLPPPPMMEISLS
jgi:hypothetical protein